ncbi:hypothetical protein [Amycolatopsis sp. Hca4]|uniref:hypothetical protein n=1 Tax=Amycolatopsis sp. Hca4 TaxID=2742131 RepID=UPI00159021AB|nr:hypothetical protein [Amycolatopsis sp. Hca4]QKV78057.1 hypothetical protein HUT10_32930 [Amycolatopsis sp. Hca4]
MQRQATWRALAVTYAIVAGMQTYLAISMDAAWARTLGAVFTFAAVGSGFAAWRARRMPGDSDLIELATPVLVLISGTRNTVDYDSRPRSRY